METKQTQAQANKVTGEMCDRIRNQGTLVGMVVISHADLEELIQKRIKESRRKLNIKSCVVSWLRRSWEF